MTQPPNDPTDLYFTIAGLDPSMSPQALNAKLSGQLMTLDAMTRQGQSVNPAYRSRVLLARDVLGFLGPKQQYDAARAAGRRPTDEELIAMTRAPIRQAMRAGRSSWTSPAMLAGYGIFGALILLTVVFGAASCGSDSDDGSPGATPGTASTAASESDTGTAADKSPLEQLEDGAEFEVVRVIDLKALAPEGDLDSGFWVDYEVIHGAGDTVELWWNAAPGAGKQDYVLILSIDKNGVPKVVRSESVPRTAAVKLTERRAQAEAAGITGVRVSREDGSPDGLQAIALDDGRIFGFTLNTDARGILYEITVKN